MKLMELIKNLTRLIFFLFSKYMTLLGSINYHIEIQL